MQRAEKVFQSLQTACLGPKRVHEPVAWPVVSVLAGNVGRMLRSVLHQQHPLTTFWSALHDLWTYFTVLHHFNELLLVRVEAKSSLYIFSLFSINVCFYPNLTCWTCFLNLFPGMQPLELVVSYTAKIAVPLNTKNWTLLIWLSLLQRHLHSWNAQQRELQSNAHPAVQ